MINLTNHECYHCQGLSRKTRTGHGNWAEWVREKQKELDDCLKRNDLNGVQRFNQQIKYGMEMMRLFERRS